MPVTTTIMPVDSWSRVMPIWSLKSPTDSQSMGATAVSLPSSISEIAKVTAAEATETIDAMKAFRLR